MRAHRRAFTVAITCISRVLILRDRVFYALGIFRHDELQGATASRHSIPSGDNRLDAAFVVPANEPARAALLICHGIAETVDTWLPVQQLLAAHGVASLLFDYSGFGKSTGHPDWSQFEQDTVAAFHCLQELEPDSPSQFSDSHWEAGSPPRRSTSLPPNALFSARHSLHSAAQRTRRAFRRRFRSSSRPSGRLRSLSPTVRCPCWLCKEPKIACSRSAWPQNWWRTAGATFNLS